jgi:hypothetical protein
VRCFLGSCHSRSRHFLSDAGWARVQVVDGVRARLPQATKPGAVVLRLAPPVPVVVLVAAVPFLVPAVLGPALSPDMLPAPSLGRQVLLPRCRTAGRRSTRFPRRRGRC